MRNKILKILLSVAVAFGLWIYVITVVSPGSEKTYYDIPVILQNETALQREGLMITAIEDNSVTMRLSGNRTDLNELNESNINIFANLSSILSPGTHRVNYTINFPGNIPSNAVTILSKDPDMLVIKVERKITQEVPVEVEYIGTVAKNHIADEKNAELDYPVIQVEGPESVVSQIKKARIQVTLDELSEPVRGEFPYALLGEDGTVIQVDDNLVTTDVAEIKGEKTINLYLSILPYKDIELGVSVTPGAGATEDTSKIQVKPKKIRICGSRELLEGLDTLVLGDVNLGEILEESTLTFPIVLPEGVTNLTGTEEATVEIGFPEITTQTMKVTQIEALNLPEDLELELVTKEVEITLRGPIKGLKDLKEADIKLTVDLANIKAGTATLPATVTLESKYADLGVIGSYSVTVTLTEKPEEER